MNELQSKELELLQVFIGICEKLNLQYYLVCGSALGAVKYKGFIPWDDDIDVVLPRADYDIFLEKAQSLMPENLFIQNYRTDSCFPKIFSKLRDSTTTYVEKLYGHLSINHGIFIDIFALDAYPQEEKERYRFEKRVRNNVRLTSCALEACGSVKSRVMRLFLRFIGFHKRTNSIIEKYERMLLSVDSGNSEFVCNYGNFRGKIDYLEKSIYGKGIEATFEGLTVRIPEKYDEYLTTKYGDWRAELPKEQQVGHHYYEICDLSRPYTDYLDAKGRIIKVKE